MTTDSFSLDLMLEQNKASKIALNERRNISKSTRWRRARAENGTMDKKHSRRLVCHLILVKNKVYILK